MSEEFETSARESVGVAAVPAVACVGEFDAAAAAVFV
jgi:hypothetical protein